MVDCQLMNGGIAGQIVFMNTSKRTQKIAQTSPPTFIGVYVHFADTISIVIARPFILSMTDSMAYALQAIVTIVFIGVERGFRLGETLHKRAKCLALGILHHTNTHLARFSTNYGTYWWTIIFVRAASTSFVRSTSRRILWVPVPFSFFPQRSGTFRRFRPPDRSRVRSFVRVRHWLATGAELP